MSDGRIRWTTEEAAAHYAEFSDSRLRSGAEDLARLVDCDDPDVVAARPAMTAELERRGIVVPSVSTAN